MRDLLTAAVLRRSAAGRLGVRPTEQSIGEFLAALGAQTPVPASGAAAALTGAMGAALAELCARVSGEEEAAGRAATLVTRLEQLAGEDADAYARFMASRSDESRARTIAVPEEIAARADEAIALVDELAPRLRRSVIGDAEAAVALARAAAAVARRLAELNAST